MMYRIAGEQGKLTCQPCGVIFDLLEWVTKGQNGVEVGDHKMLRISCTFASCILISEFLYSLTF